MEKKLKKALHAIGCAIVTFALVLSILPANQTHAATKPAKVKSVKVSQIKTTTVKITWKKASSKSVKGYQVRMYNGKKAAKKYTIKKRTSVTKKVTGLKAKTKYTVKVRAYKGGKHKIYGKWSTIKKFTTKKKAVTTKPSNNNNNSNNNSNSSTHTHNYGAVKHATVWNTVTVDHKFDKSDKFATEYPLLEQGYTEKVLVKGAYTSCSCGAVKIHDHQLIKYNSIIAYKEVKSSYHICACGEKFKTDAELANHQFDAYEKNLSGHGSSSVSTTETWTKVPARTETVIFEACSICGQVKSN